MTANWGDPQVGHPALGEVEDISVVTSRIDSVAGVLQGTGGAINPVLGATASWNGGGITTASAALTGGTIDGIPIGVSTPSEGHFTSLSTSSSVTFASISTSSRYQDKTGDVTPVGSIMAFAGISAPTGWLICDGSSLLRVGTYADLFAVIGVSYGTSDSAAHFNIPDMRGMFARGWDNGAGNDPDSASRTAAKVGGNTGDNVGSYEADAMLSHTHVIPVTLGKDGGGGGSLRMVQGSDNTATTSAGSSTETRPKNINVNYIIKY